MLAERSDHRDLTGIPHCRIPSIFSFIRYRPLRAQMYRVFPSASPQVKLCGCFGGMIVPRCLPCDEMIHKPPGPEKSFVTSFTLPSFTVKTPLKGNSLRGSLKNFGKPNGGSVK